MAGASPAARSSPRSPAPSTTTASYAAKRGQPSRRRAATRCTSRSPRRRPVPAEESAAQALLSRQLLRLGQDPVDGRELPRTHRPRKPPRARRRGRLLCSLKRTITNRLTPWRKVVACPWHLQQERCFMPSSIRPASSPAGTAGTEPRASRPKRVDFVTGYCGLSRPTLFERIGIMAADKPTSGRPESSAPHQRCARVPVRPTATPHRVRTGPHRSGAGYGWGRQGGHRACRSWARTSPTAAVTGRRLRRRGHAHTRAGPVTRSGRRHR